MIHLKIRAAPQHNVGEQNFVCGAHNTDTWVYLAALYEYTEALQRTELTSANEMFAINMLTCSCLACSLMYYHGTICLLALNTKFMCG